MKSVIERLRAAVEASVARHGYLKHPDHELLEAARAVVLADGVGVWACAAVHPAGFACTLPVGHDGRHEAHGFLDEPPLFTWPI